MRSRTTKSKPNSSAPRRLVKPYRESKKESFGCKISRETVNNLTKNAQWNATVEEAANHLIDIHANGQPLEFDGRMGEGLASKVISQ
jgi:hypothetical protein